MIKIGITIGDPAGVGPELILRLLPYLDPEKVYVVYGEKKVMWAVQKELGMDFPAQEVQNVQEVEEPGLYLVDLNVCDRERPEPSVTSGKVAVAYLGRAVADAICGRLHGILTMPLHKFWASRAGFSYQGQTEFLAKACNCRDYAMLMYSEKIKVVPFTTHIPLREVPQRVKKEEIVKKVKLVVREYAKLFGVEPSVGVLGLNPHAGDMGAIGQEDMEEILPAVEALKEEGYAVEGPLSPDSAFLREGLDLYLCMYHDQGLIPLSLIHI
ncbi:MAG: 4-hydroxythreonine-4-phosphate dehydrogenase PdxA [Aquificaceae bacterium]|nr:4-hydroxythreonine-4-phosphate dehydrogenase PdxA [Aquificaceae bacterium]